MSALWLYPLALIEGATVILCEFSGSRLLTPFLGNSLYMWTSIIATTIFFLTAGYWLGGRLSQRMYARKWIALCFAATACWLLLIPDWILYLIPKLADLDLRVSGLLLTSLSLGLPALLMGMCSPFMIQLFREQVLVSGKVAGKIFAFSTLGALIFTLFSGFYFLPVHGIIWQLMLMSSMLIIVGSVLRFTWWHVPLITAFAVGFLHLRASRLQEEWSGQNARVQYISESLHGQLKVYDEYFPLEELEYRFLLINGICQTMIVNNDVVVSTWKYVHRTSRVAALKRGGDALLLGMGGGSMASELRKLEFKCDLLDIDPRMFEVAKRFFYYKADRATEIVDDARHYLNECEKKYDLIVADLVSGEVQPSNLFTKEGVRLFERVLKDDGLLIINYQELQDGSQPSAHHSICNTFLGGNFQVQFHKADSKCPDIVTVISKKPVDISKIPDSILSSSYQYLGIMQDMIKEPFVKVNRPFRDGMILTDDRPMLDVLNASTIRFWRNDANQQFALKQLRQHKPIFF